MTIKEFQFIIELQKEFEFSYNKVNYNLTYDRDSKGNLIIVFGERYFGKPYSSFGQLMNTARVENHFLKEILKDI